MISYCGRLLLGVAIVLGSSISAANANSHDCGVIIDGLDKLDSKFDHLEIQFSKQMPQHSKMMSPEDAFLFHKHAMKMSTVQFKRELLLQYAIQKNCELDKLVQPLIELLINQEKGWLQSLQGEWHNNGMKFFTITKNRIEFAQISKEYGAPVGELTIANGEARTIVTGNQQSFLIILGMPNEDHLEMFLFETEEPNSEHHTLKAKRAN
jgi:hypothetical protein